MIRHRELFTKDNEVNDQNPESYNDQEMGEMDQVSDPAEAMGNVQLDPIEGYDNDLDRNLAVKKRYIAKLRQDMMMLQHEHQELIALGGQGSEIDAM